MSKTVSVTVTRVPKPKSTYELPRWYGRNGPTLNMGLQFCQIAEQPGVPGQVEMARINLLGTRGPIHSGGFIEAALLDEICQMWLAARAGHKQYAENGSCPKCGEPIEGGDIDMQYDEYTTQEISCTSCGWHGVDFYLFLGYKAAS